MKSVKSGHGPVMADMIGSSSAFESQIQSSAQGWKCRQSATCSSPAFEACTDPSSPTTDGEAGEDGEVTVCLLFISCRVVQTVSFVFFFVLCRAMRPRSGPAICAFLKRAALSSNDSDRRPWRNQPRVWHRHHQFYGKEGLTSSCIGCYGSMLCCIAKSF